MRFLRSEGARSYLSRSVIVFAVVQMLLLYISSSCPAHGQVEEEEGSAANASNTTHFPSPSPSPSSTTTLNFIFISSDNPTLRTSGSIPAVDIALEMVHQSGLLGDKYKLAYKPPLDSQCSRTQALDVFHAALREEKEKEEGEEEEGENEEEKGQSIAIIGAGCSVATLPVAEICHYYNLPMLSWSSAAAELSNRQRFRSNYRLAPSELNYSPGLAALLKHYKWSQLAFLTQQESLFLASQRLVTSLLPNVTIETSGFRSHVADPTTTPDFFFASLDMRVFVINMYVDKARSVLCEASKRGMNYPRYLWITPGWYGDLWWEKELPGDCTVKDMERVLSHSLSVVMYPLVNESQISSLNISTDGFRTLYKQRLYYLGYIAKVRNYTVDLTAPLAFDAVWTLAYAVRSTIDKIERGDEGRCVNMSGNLVLEQFNHSNDKLGCLLLESLDEVFFLGISGNVTFDRYGDRVGNTVRISQYQPGGGRARLDGSGTNHMGVPLIAYATFDFDGRQFSDLTVSLVTDNSTVLWPEGVTPDGIPKEVIVATEIVLTVIYYILAVAGVIFAVVCLLFNIIFRKRRIVRLTSPNLNYLIILGTLLLYLSVFLWVTPTDEQMEATILCNFRIWSFSIGNTLCLAVVLSKMWRVHYIFTSPSPKRKPKPPQDWHLLIITSVLLSVDLIILLIPTAIEKSRSHGELTDSQEHTESEDELGVEQVHLYYSCYSNSQLIWLFFSYIYKFLLQIAAIYFAFMSRKIRVKALNDSKEIAAIIYITSLLLVISAFGFWIGILYLNTSTAVFALAQLLTATVILGFLFIPKMISLRLDPQGANIFSTRNHNTTASVNQSSIDVIEAGHKMQELNSRVKELEAELEKYQGGINSMTTYTCNTTTPTSVSSPDSKLANNGAGGMEPET